MRRLFLILSFFAALFIVANCFNGSVKYFDAMSFDVTGKAFDSTQLHYSRLPLDSKEEIREELWSLGLNSAGVSVRFSTNSTRISARWTLLNNFSMSHMPGTGIRGMDLYYLDGDKWIYAGTAQPRGKESESTFIKNMEGVTRDYLIHLPLYDGVEKLEIGIDSGASIGEPLNSSLSSTDGKDPLVFYGTSITQGGCASRPGMAYPAIISRNMDRRSVNMGFSGNARMDRSMAEVLSRIDAHAYVIDCLPNCTAAIVRDSALNFMLHIIEKRPETTIYMISEVEFPYFRIDAKSKAEHDEKNREWFKAYNTLIDKGYKNIHYIDASDFIGNDGEATVDGNHFTDLGFYRFALKLTEGLNK